MEPEGRVPRQKEREKMIDNRPENGYATNKRTERQETSRFCVKKERERNRMQESALEPEREEGENLFLTFLVGRDSYALAIDYVNEIVQLQPIVPVPQQQVFMRGVMNLRGNIIPVLDLKQRLGGAETQPTDRTCIIITDIGGVRAGFIVDNVSEVVNISPADILPVSDTGSSGDGCICAMARNGDGVRMVLDCGAVLGQERYDMAKTPYLTE